MGKKLYVGNLDSQTTSENLRDLFAGAGQIVSAQIITDRSTQRSKGFAFIEMASDADALKAISLYNGHSLNNRAMIVSQARSREENQTSQSNGGRRADSKAQPRFREAKHKSRGGANKRRF